MVSTESSGTVAMRRPAAAKDATAPPNNTVGGVLRAVAATGSSAGDRSIALPISGRTLSLEASKTPIRSFSSASFNKGIAEVNVNPAFSNRLRRPSCDV